MGTPTLRPAALRRGCRPTSSCSTGGKPDYASLLDEEIGAWSDTVLSAMTELHARRPIDPHFYLLLLGTDPATQGQGRATRLLQPVLRICDTDGFPAYFQSTNPKTAGIYRRLSFRSVGHHRCRMVRVSNSYGATRWHLPTDEADRYRRSPRAEVTT